MDITTKRKMNQVLRGIIGSGFYGTQEDLVEALWAKDFEVTQSTVSRSLKKLGIIKSQTDQGSFYQLKVVEPKLLYGQKIYDLILKLDHNENMIVAKTTPGAAMFVAGFIDQYCSQHILGTVAGDDHILIVPKSVKKISATVKHIQSVL